MKSFRRATQTMAFALLFSFVGAYAQTDIPSNGACFYRGSNYGGSYFCTQTGQTAGRLPSGFNDAIQSIRIFGNAQVTVFNDNDLGGANAVIQNDVADLRALPMANDPSRNWSTRISSLRVDASANTVNRPWNYIWGRQQTTTSSGACFFDQPNFRGRSFCVDQGRELNNLPAGFNDRIVSIQVFGNSEVQIFGDSEFAGAAARTSRDVPDLSSWKIPDDPSRNWAGRISSLRVDKPNRGRWSNTGGYGRRGYGDERQEMGLVRCSSQSGSGKQVCASQGYIRDARMINSYGNCRKNLTWGIDNGRLWVSGDCTADFEVER